MENAKENAQKRPEAFHLSDENTKRLIKLVAADKLDGLKTTRSGVVNHALDCLFDQESIKIQLGKIA